MQPRPTAAIVGAGLMGRLLGWQLQRKGWQVTLFDRDGEAGTASCSWAGAGMLTPIAELEKAESCVARWGLRALDRWEEWLPLLPEPVFFQRKGSMVVAHRQEWAELHAMAERLRRVEAPTTSFRQLGNGGIEALEPELEQRFSRGFFFPEEGQVEPRELLPALAKALRAGGADWCFGESIEEVLPGQVPTNSGMHRADWVIDTRGLGAKPQMSALRGVRGELIRLHAPEVTLSRPVRLMHPRYPLYVVPRPNQVYLVGATSIESEDCSGISVRSTLELLSAAYSLHPGFAEARVLETVVDCRPALPDHLPRISYQPGLMRINGLYRHGFLLAPALVEVAEALLVDDIPSPIYEDLPIERQTLI